MRERRAPAAADGKRTIAEAGVSPLGAELGGELIDRSWCRACSPGGLRRLSAKSAFPRVVALSARRPSLCAANARVERQTQPRRTSARGEADKLAGGMARAVGARARAWATHAHRRRGRAVEKSGDGFHARHGLGADRTTRDVGAGRFSRRRRSRWPPPIGTPPIRRRGHAIPTGSVARSRLGWGRGDVSATRSSAPGFLLVHASETLRLIGSYSRPSAVPRSGEGASRETRDGCADCMGGAK